MSSPTAPSTAEEILKGLGEFAKASTARVTAYASSSASQDNGNYTLQVLFYLFLYAFIIFLALILIHFTIYPVFKFTPGAKGFIGVSSTKDSIVYWNDKKQPGLNAYAPIDTDSLSKLPLANNFSVSVDLFVRRMTDTTAGTRVILYKTYANGEQVTPRPSLAIQDPLSIGPTSEVTDLANQYMNSRVSMFMYLTKTNDLVVTFFSGSTGTPYSSRPIKNIPLYKPFRVTVVVEDKTFTVYINAQQAFQRTIPSSIPIVLNTHIPSLGNSETVLATQRFFPPPEWADRPVKTVFLQNLQVWPRAISYAEVQTAQPALALEADFGMPTESGSSSCT